MGDQGPQYRMANQLIGIVTSRTQEFIFINVLDSSRFFIENATSFIDNYTPCYCEIKRTEKIEEKHYVLHVM